jgi:hypothetical protein
MSSFVFWISTLPGVSWIVPIRSPFLYKPQFASDGLVLTEICWLVPDKIDAQLVSIANESKGRNFMSATPGRDSLLVTHQGRTIVF